MSLVAVSVIGDDQPGIVAGVTKALFEAGCNLQDVSSTILRGHFSMVLIVELALGDTPENLEERVAAQTSALGLLVAVRPVGEAHHAVDAPTHMVSVYGADRPGIVFHVADRLSTLGANVTDLTSRVLGEDQPVYALMLEVAAAGSDIEGALETLKSELGVDVSVRPIEADLL